MRITCSTIINQGSSFYLLHVIFRILKGICFILGYQFIEIYWFPRVDGVQKLPKQLWARPRTLTYDVRPSPWKENKKRKCCILILTYDVDLWPSFLILGWKLYFYIFDHGDLDLWPMTLTFEVLWDMLLSLQSANKQTHKDTKILLLWLMREVMIQWISGTPRNFTR